MGCIQLQSRSWKTLHYYQIQTRMAWPSLVSWLANKVNCYLLPHIILGKRRSIIVIVMLVSHVVVSLIKVDCVVLISIWGSGISQRWSCIPESAWKVQAIIFIPSIVCWLLQISNLLQKVWEKMCEWYLHWSPHSCNLEGRTTSKYRIDNKTWSCYHNCLTRKRSRSSPCRSR